MPSYVSGPATRACGGCHRAHYINEDDCPGLRKGGVLNVVRHALEVSCRADAIPEYFEIDLTGLNPIQSYQVLVSQLLVSFDNSDVIDDLPNVGQLIAESSTSLSLASSERKLLITAMLDGACGGSLVSSGL